MTPNGVPADLSNVYSAQFGSVAVEMGFITEAQLQEAMAIHLCAKQQIPGYTRLVPTILFEEGWMTAAQVEQVLDAILKDVGTGNDSKSFDASGNI
ncbi:hypothetical protein [Herbaspirillum sp. ST 5-3]|uniref:hypothetical protein n=1 Tax=Oxalobacteraceae TaxID=75682 RepID=UPI0010A4806B|nr:hypothetical protein [Herbaspirillum sp. ST 5-3]